MLALLPVFKPWACGNYYYALDKEGKIIPLGYDWKFPFSKNFNLELNVQKLKNLEKKLLKEKNFMLLSDYSLCLMKLGKSKEAAQILKELYIHYPNEYKIAANLGTAYELVGEVDSALKYIRRGIQLNPNDHEGSEWIHAKILETKLQLKKNVNYLDTHTVLDLTEKQKKDSTVFYHLSIQLKERFPFTSGPDALMAGLMADLGDLSFNVKSIEYAKAYYLIAKEYYGNTSPELEVKIKETGKLIRKYKDVQPAPEKPGEYFEGARTKIHGINYKDIISDNNQENYKVNWTKINTDVTSLLALVDFKKAVTELKDTAYSKSSDELKLIPEHKDNISQIDSSAISKTEINPAEQKKQEGLNIKTICIFITCSVIFIVIGFILSKKKKQ